MDKKIQNIDKQLKNVKSDLKFQESFLQCHFKDSYVFEKIYSQKKWGTNKQGKPHSGNGSVVENALPYIDYLQNFINTHDVTSILDVGCGDWQIMSSIDILQHVEDKGVDASKYVIDQNKEKYNQKNVKFKHIRDLNDIKNIKGDLIVIKEVMQHWDQEQSLYFINKILPNFKRAIICNRYSYSKEKNNKSIKLGGFTCMDLGESPYNLKFSNSFIYEKGLIKGEYLQVVFWENQQQNK